MYIISGNSNPILANQISLELKENIIDVIKIYPVINNSGNEYIGINLFATMRPISE